MSIPLVWSASGGTIDSTGLFTAGDSLGRYRIMVKQSSSTVADSAVVAVAASAPTPQSVVLTPGSVTLAPGGTAAFAAVVNLSDGTTGTQAVNFTGTGGSISASGAYTAGGIAGTYRVVAAVGPNGPADTALVTVTIAPTACSGTPTIICPGDNIQAKVSAAGSGAMFTIRAGIHRLQSITPKTGQQFIGEPGAILSGARLLTGWTQSGATWYVDGQTQQGAGGGQCAGGRICGPPDDVYRDNVLLRRVGSVAAVTAGTFYFDYAADRIYVGDNPSGHTLEGAVTPYAFEGSAFGAGTGVTIRGLVIEKYATPAQDGALGHTNMAANWTVRDCEIRFNHGAGIRGGSNVTIARNNIHHNGQLGVLGYVARVDSNEVAYNNTAGFAEDWEAGGIKFSYPIFATATGERALGNWIHHNYGIGLWADTNHDGMQWIANTIEDNPGGGMHFEVSYSATITGNTIRRNGASDPSPSEGAGILIMSSGGSGIEISGNVLEGNKNGIMLIQTDRGSGSLGPYLVKNVNVHHNMVTLSGTQRHGAVRYGGDTGLWTTNNNSFENNTYKLTGADATPFEWAGARRTDAQWRAYGNDEAGNLTR